MLRSKPGFKSDPVRRWGRPDRMFFAHGACHILACAFLERWPEAGYSAIWIRPRPGFAGNHIFVSDGRYVFDYHGYSRREAFVAHEWLSARRYWPGWDADLVPLPAPVLISEALSKTYPGLWLREPGQFLHDALPRARGFLARFGPPPKGALSAKV